MDQPPKIDKAQWPTESKTLAELVDKLIESTPWIDEKVAQVLRENPDLLTHQREADGTQTVSSYKLGRIAAICILDFVCWAFDRPDLGYVKGGPGEKSK